MIIDREKYLYVLLTYEGLQDGKWGVGVGGVETWIRKLPVSEY